MTQFDKSLIQISGGYVTYGPERRFIARFKYRAGDAKGFASFIAKHFTVEEYFGRLDSGECPLPIAESKGYLLPHIKRWLRERGLPLTLEGVRMMLDQNRAARLENMKVMLGQGMTPTQEAAAGEFPIA